MAHAAFVQPERQIAIFDAIANAWLDLENGVRSHGVFAAATFVADCAGCHRGMADPAGSLGCLLERR